MSKNGKQEGRIMGKVMKWNCLRSHSLSLMELLLLYVESCCWESGGNPWGFVCWIDTRRVVVYTGKNLVCKCLRRTRRREAERSERKEGKNPKTKKRESWETGNLRPTRLISLSPFLRRRFIQKTFSNTLVALVQHPTKTNPLRKYSAFDFLFLL